MNSPLHRLLIPLRKETIATKSLQNYTSGLRGAAGDADLVDCTYGKYGLTRPIHTDWAQFQEHLAEAATVEGPARLDHLRAGLLLVEGKPFDGAEGTMAWAATDGFISQMEVAITDTASTLAEEALRRDEPDLATWAARQGLKACPWMLRLYSHLLRAHSTRGDDKALDHTWREAKNVAGREQLPPDLRDLYATLSGQRNSAH